MYLIIFLFIVGCSSPVKELTKACPKPEIIDETGRGVTDHDRATLKNLVELERCKAHYNDAPCVMALYKRGIQRYYVHCGEKK